MTDKKFFQSPEKTALSELVKKPEELDQTESVYGEAIREEELDGVTGGTADPAVLERCPVCDCSVYRDMVSHCMGGRRDDECPYVNAKPKEPEPSIGPSP